MQSFKAFLVLVACGLASPETTFAQVRFGAHGAEAEPGRRQPWLVPTPSAEIAARAWLLRPPGDGPFRLAVIAHASTQNALRRAQMPQPEYRALAAFLVARGFAVLVPERPGHGATGGRYLEDHGSCDGADYTGAGRATAGALSAAAHFVRKQPFIRPEGMVIVGHSAGAWGALALAGENPANVSAIIAFAPGRGGQADDEPNKVCSATALIAATAEFGKSARVPVTWLVAANDTYFPPEISRRMADAFGGGRNGRIIFRVLASSGGEGHWLVESEAGVKTAQSELERALKAPPPAAGRKAMRR